MFAISIAYLQIRSILTSFESRDDHMITLSSIFIFITKVSISGSHYSITNKNPNFLMKIKHQKYHSHVPYLLGQPAPHPQCYTSQYGCCWNTNKNAKGPNQEGCDGMRLLNDTASVSKTHSIFLDQIRI